MILIEGQNVAENLVHCNFTAKITCGPAPQPSMRMVNIIITVAIPIGVGAIPMTYLTLADRVNHY